MREIAFQKEKIDVEKAVSRCGSGADGAVVSFVGRVRNSSEGKDVVRLEYDLYDDMAVSEMEKIVSEANDRWEISDCTVIHRYGRIDVGEVSILIVVSSPHRDAAFQAVRYIIDTVKKKVPIWKKEFYSDGSSRYL